MKRRRFCPVLEQLEDRITPDTTTLYWWPQGSTPTNLNWNGSNGGLSNWSDSNTTYNGHAAPTDTNPAKIGFVTGITNTCFVNLDSKCAALSLAADGPKLQVNDGCHLSVKTGAGSTTIKGEIDYGSAGTAGIEFDGGSVDLGNAGGTVVKLGVPVTGNTPGTMYFDNGATVSHSADVYTYANLYFGDYPSWGATTTTGATVNFTGSHQLRMYIDTNVYVGYGTFNETFSGAGNALIDGDSTTHKFYVGASAGAPTVNIDGNNVTFSKVPVEIDSGNLTVKASAVFDVVTKDGSGRNIFVSQGTLDLKASSTLELGGSGPLLYAAVGTVKFANGTTVQKDTDVGTSGTLTLELSNSTLEPSVAGSTLSVNGVLKTDYTATVGAYSVINFYNVDGDTGGFSRVNTYGLDLQSVNITFVFGHPTGGTKDYSRIVDSGTASTNSVASTVVITVQNVDVPQTGDTMQPISDTGSNLTVGYTGDPTTAGSGQPPWWVQNGTYGATGISFKLQSM